MQNIHNKITAFILLLVSLCVSVLGCSNRNQNNLNNQVINTPIVHELPVMGGTLSMPMPLNAVKTNPYSVDTEEMMVFYSLIYEGLVSIDEKNTIVPALAENWTCDSTNRIWTLNLRRDAKWHNSEESLDANDVEYSYNKICSYEGSSYYSYAVSKIESVSSEDKYTVVVTMKEPGILSLRCLAFPIVKSGASLTGKSVGTGPYILETYDDESAYLKANENWWKKRPYIDAVRFLARDSNETALASFAAGQFNFVPTSAITAGRYRQDGNSNVLDVMTQDMEVMIVNHDNALLSDLRVRQALSCIVDRNELISNVCMNRARACDVPIAPDSWLYESKSKLYDHNEAKAKELLGLALCTDSNNDGFLEKNGSDIELKILVCNSLDGTRTEAAKHIAQQFLKVGIKTVITNAEHSNDDSEFMTKLKNGEFDIAIVGFNMARDCDLSPYLAYGGECNYGGYYNCELEMLAKAMYNAKDEEELRQKASEFQIEFANELPFIVLYFRLNSIVYSSDIKNITSAREPEIMQNIDKWYIS